MVYCNYNCIDVAYYLIRRKAVQQGVPFDEIASEFWHRLSFLIHRQILRNILNRYQRVSFQHTEEKKIEKEEDET